MKFSNLEEATKHIATEIAKEKFAFQKSASDYTVEQEEQKKLQLMLIEIPQNEEMVRNSIESVYSSIEKSNPGENLPKDLRLVLANFISDQVESKNIKEANQIDISPVAVTQMLKAQGMDLNYETDIELKETKGMDINNLNNTNISKEMYENMMKEKYGGYYYSENDFENVKEGVDESLEQYGEGVLDEILEKANNGDRESARKLMVLQKVFTQIGLNSGKEEIPEENLREYLETMILAMEFVPSEETQKICEKMAKKLSVDVFAIDENGNKILDKSKLLAEHKKVDEGIGFDLENALSAYDYVVDIYLKSPEARFESIEEMKKEMISSGQGEMIKHMYDISLTEGSREAVGNFKELCEKYSDGARQFAELLYCSESERNEEIEKQLGEVLFKSLIEKRKDLSETLIDQMVSAHPSKSKEILMELIEKSNEGHDVTTERYVHCFGNSIKKIESEKTEKAQEEAPTQNNNLRNYEDDDFER